MRHRGEVKETITETHQYIYAGGKLLRETITEGEATRTLDFVYDNAGNPYSLIYNNGTTTTTYYSGAVSVKMRQANRMQGAASSNCPCLRYSK